MLPTKIIIGENQVFTPMPGGEGYYYYSGDGRPKTSHTETTWSNAVEQLRGQSVKFIYAKPINKEDWL